MKALFCPTCGAERTDQAVGGQCVHCMLKLALEPLPGELTVTAAVSEPEQISDDSSAHGVGVTKPAQSVE